jgi:aminoglycoside phosphotransferase (APT) family kinase protein
VIDAESFRAEKLRAGKLDVDAGLVQRLVARQFPHWADLPVSPVARDGWDNWTFHLGERMKVRLPSHASYVLGAIKEITWLPRLAPHLPVAIPRLLAVGEPDESYPFRWSVWEWLPGETAARERIPDLPAFGRELAAFLAALEATDCSGGPPAGEQSFFRGGDLGVYDTEARQCIAELRDRIDGAAALATWDAALATKWTKAPVWVHGDVAIGNLLVDSGRLSAVIDFGQLSAGDPACDLVIAWVFLDEETRAAFRIALPLDAGTWARARGWALWKAALVVARNLPRNPAENPPEQVIAAVVAEHRWLA